MGHVALPFPSLLKHKPEQETFSNYPNKKNQIIFLKKLFSTFSNFSDFEIDSQRDFIKKKNGIFRSGPTGLEYGEAFHHESP